MKFRSYKILFFLLISTSLIGCNKISKLLYPEKLEISIDLKDYPFLKKNEIGVDFHIYNPTNGEIVISHLNKDGSIMIALAYEWLVYHTSEGDVQLEIEERRSEKARHQQWNPFELRMIHEFVVIPPKDSVTYKMIAYRADKKAITRKGTIIGTFIGPVKNIGKENNVNSYKKLEFYKIKSSSKPVKVPTRIKR